MNGYCLQKMEAMYAIAREKHFPHHHLGQSSLAEEWRKDQRQEDQCENSYDNPMKGWLSPEREQ